MSEFKQKVITAVKTVPYGCVASYGQVALMVGIPRAARQVGWVLNSLETNFKDMKPFPWWRIVNNQGRISIKGTKHHGAELQKKLLEQEGLQIRDDLTFDIEQYRFCPSIEQLKNLQLSDEVLDMYITKYSL